MNTDPHWTAYLSALLTPIVAVFGIYIAWQQWRTARNKLKFELFTRRLAVYEAARSLLVAPMRLAEQPLAEVVQRFAGGTAEARWLFDVSVAEYLRKDLWRKALELQVLEDE